MAISKKLKFCGTFKIFVNTEKKKTYWKFQNATPPTVLVQSEPSFVLNKAVKGEYKVMDILATLANIKHFGDLLAQVCG